jgi:hypothetical protein
VSPTVISGVTVEPAATGVSIVGWVVLKPESPLCAAVAAANAANPAAATASSILREFFIRDSPFGP